MITDGCSGFNVALQTIGVPNTYPDNDDDDDDDANEQASSLGLRSLCLWCCAFGAVPLVLCLWCSTQQPGPYDANS